MKVLYNIALCCAMFGLTATTSAAPVEEIEESVLLPGTTVVAGDPEKQDFYVATEEEAPKIVKGVRLAREAVQVKEYNLKYANEHKKIRYNPDTLAAVNVDMKQLLNKYAKYETKVTLIKGKEKVSTRPFASVVADAKAAVKKLKHIPKIKVAKTMGKSKRVLTRASGGKSVVQPKFVVKTLTFDKNHKLKIVGTI